MKKNYLCLIGLLSLTSQLSFSQEVTDTIKTQNIEEIKINSKKIKILIVEDNKINMLLTKTLILKQFKNAMIIEAENGEEAIQKYQKQKPHITLMDIQMPVKNGYEAAEEILQMNPKAIIIALTAGIFTGEREKCLEIGMVDFVVKPLDKELFDTKLLKWIKTL